jgi:hypothetical protein
VPEWRSDGFTRIALILRGPFIPSIRIRHRSSGIVLAEGPLGWGFTPFEGNYYIAKRYLVNGRFAINGIPGLSIYKFLFFWMDLHLLDGRTEKSPFIWFRVVLPGDDRTLMYETIAAPGSWIPLVMSFTPSINYVP